MNQAILARLWLVDDEIVGADFTPAYRRLLADNLAAEIAAEETRGQTERVLFRTSRTGVSRHAGLMSQDIPD